MRKIKEIKPSYIVDMDQIESLDEIAVAFALAKQEAKLPLDDEDVIAIAEFAASIARPDVRIYNVECVCKPRLPWYKRFWNWLTRKNK